MSNQQEDIDEIISDYKTKNHMCERHQKVDLMIGTIQKNSNSTDTNQAQMKYVYTMSDWKTNPVPFNLMIERKEIIRTNPHDNIPSGVENSHDLELDEVRRTRPRLVMTPAVSMDDVDDDKRQILLKNNYTTQMMRDFRDRGRWSNVTTPLRGKYAPAMPITLPKYKPHYVAREWRKQSVSWDRRQLRGFCEPTRKFWLDRKPKHITK